MAAKHGYDVDPNQVRIGDKHEGKVLLTVRCVVVLLTVCLFIPCVTLCCCFCRTALLYLGQVAVVNENLFSTGLPG